jgi:predicted negative regulator of RcsB-dependent stress response
MLVVGCRLEEIPYVSKFLQDLEQSLPSHLVAVFGQDFVQPGPWLDAIVAAIQAQLDFAGPARAERGEPPFPPLPLELCDPRGPAPQRLLALLRYLPTLLPREDNQHDYRMVVGLLPLRCPDPIAFAELLAHAVPHPTIPPWMTALRLVVWDELEIARLRTGIAAWPAVHVLSYSEDFSTPALTDALGKDAGDRSLPLDERMGAVTQLAALDFAYKRYPAALDKYAALHEHYFQSKQPELQALALLGAGDTLHAAGDPKTAKLRLQQGIALAMQHKSLPVLVCLLSSVHKVSMALGHHEDAESYADSGTKVAAAAVNPFAYCDFFAQRGDAQVARGKLPDAIESYNKAREQCRANEYLETWKAVIDKQIAIYAKAGMDAEVRTLEDERRMVERLEQNSPRRRSA